MLASSLLYMLGYKVDTSLVKVFSSQKIGIFPHTSRFESGIVCLALLSEGLEKRTCFAVAEEYIDAAHTGWWLKYFGGFAVRKGTGTTKTVSDYMKANPDKMFAISPEGSLSPKEWKRGFFWVAMATGAPIVIWGVDFTTHTIKAYPGEFYVKDGDSPDTVIPKIQEAFANCGICPLYPEKSNPKILLPDNVKPSMLPLRGKIFVGSLGILVVGMILLPIMKYM